MPHKILTVDDSKTVRIIVRKAFKGYDCEISEATNGVEGLAAAKAHPNLILLDVTMPVMDGIEMLTKLKADPQTKGIPVIMLTAEGGRDNVLKIAKIGVRDYIVKPFKDEALLQKLGRVLELKQLAPPASKVRTILDTATILVVDDKPAIVHQIQEGLKHMPWKIHGAQTPAAALEFCAQKPPDLVIVSLGLPDEAAFQLFRAIRASQTGKSTPVFGLTVKIESLAQQKAKEAGFAIVITKPISMTELEQKMTKAMNLDTSPRYYLREGEVLVIRLPANCTPEDIGEVRTHLKAQLTEAVDAGRSKVLIDIQALQALDIRGMRLLIDAMQFCREMGMRFATVATPQLIEESKGFEEARTWVVSPTLEEARASLDLPVPAQASEVGAK
jgi:two-component system cell cycle response regulator